LDSWHAERERRSWERQTHTTTHPGLLPLSALIGGQRADPWALAVEESRSRIRRRTCGHLPTVGWPSLVPALSNARSTVLQFFSLRPWPKLQHRNSGARCPCAASSLSSRYLARPQHLRGMPGRQHLSLLCSAYVKRRGMCSETMPNLAASALSSAANGLGTRCFTATSSGYSASTSIAFRSTTKYNVAPRAVWRGHP
jgi:hypothetical protein